MAAAEPIRDKKAIQALANYYLEKKQLRNYLLIVAGIHTALRISDILKLRWCNVFDFHTHRYKKQIDITETKTGKRKSIALNTSLIKAIQRYHKSEPEILPDSFIFQNNRKGNQAISRIQAYRIIRAASEIIGFQEAVSCHSLRKTFGYHAWKKGVPIAVIMDIYNHSSYSVTRCYLGINQDDRNRVYQTMCLL